MTRSEAAAAAARALAGGTEDEQPLLEALATAEYRDNFPDLLSQVQAYSMLAYYYAQAKDTKRHKRGPEKFAWQFMEEHIEGLLKTLDKGIVATMHANNLTGRHNL